MSRIDEALRRARMGAATERAELQSADGLTATQTLAGPLVVDAAPTVNYLSGVDRIEEPKEPQGREGHADVEPMLGRRIASDDMPSGASESSFRFTTQAGNSKLIGSNMVEPAAIEQYRKLAVTLHQMQVERGTRVVMVASAVAGEGKTLTSANLGLTLSESLRREVLLIDADMRRPSQHDIFQIPNVGGLSDGLSSKGDEKLTLIKVSPHLTVLPAGRPDPNPMGGLTSARMRRILEEASAKFDWVIIDTPPIGVLSDASVLAEMADTVVLVISAGTTPFKPIQKAVAALGRQRIAGIVLNRVASAGSSYQYYARHYYARQQAGVLEVGTTQSQ